MTDLVGREAAELDDHTLGAGSGHRAIERSIGPSGQSCALPTHLQMVIQCGVADREVAKEVHVVATRVINSEVIAATLVTSKGTMRDGERDEICPGNARLRRAVCDQLIVDSVQRGDGFRQALMVTKNTAAAGQCRLHPR